MSTSTIVSLRLSHLAQAAQSLAATSPAVSGHLRNAEHRLASGEGRPLSITTNSRLCKACGSALILGWNCEISTRSSAKKRKKRTRQDRIQKKDITKSIDVRCSRCDKVTTLEALKKTAVVDVKRSDRQLPVKVQATKPAIQHSMEVTKTAPSEMIPAPSAAKKRTRNKKSSLQSMLDSRKPTPQSKGYGLGLADFMTG